MNEKRTITGRVPREPNMQNIPVRTEVGAQIRRAFTGEPATEDQRPGDVILQQLGGRKFTTMVGVKNMVRLDNGLRFDLIRMAAQRINCVSIRVTARDSYDLVFYRKGGINCDEIKRVLDVPVENLRLVFETETGLRTSL